jgi:hypothetical protein
VHLRVREQVADDLPQPALVAEHDRDVGERLVQVEGDRPVRLHGAGVVDGVAGDRGEVDRRDGERPLLVQPGEQQQVLHEQPHAAALGLDPLHEPADVVLGADGALPVELGEAADRRQRSAQLVAGVGHEAADPLLRRTRLLLGGLLRPEGVLDPGQHPVEGGGEPADLGPVVACGHPLGEVAGRDRPGGALDARERPQAVAHQQVGRSREDRQDHQADHQFDADQPADGRLVAGQVRADDQGVAALQFAGEHPPRRLPVGRGHGHRFPGRTAWPAPLPVPVRPSRVQRRTVVGVRWPLELDDLPTARRHAGAVRGTPHPAVLPDQAGLEDVSVLLPGAHRRAQLGVPLVAEVVLQQRGGRDAGGEQADRHQRHEQCDEGDPERDPGGVHVPRGSRRV